MELQQYNASKHYEDCVIWWKLREFPVVPQAMLSHTGFVVEGVAACWYYPVFGSGFCYLGFPVTNPSVDKEKRDQALDLIMENIIDTTKKLGYKYLITTTGLDVMRNKFNKHGFVLGDQNIDQFIKRL
jgi:hypothetical protein